MSWIAKTETDCCPWPAHCGCQKPVVRAFRAPQAPSGPFDLNASGDNWELVLMSLERSAA